MPTEKRLLGVDGVKQIAAEVYGIISAHNTGENSHDNLKTRISDLENSIDSFATEDYVDNAVDEIDVLTEAEISEICGSTVGNLTLVDQDAVAEQVVDTLMDEIDFLTKEEISEICGSTVGDLTVVDQDAIAEQVVDTLMEELPTNQALVDNVAERVPLVKVAEQPTFVDSVDEMIDTNKAYVLNSDGMFYSYKVVTIPGETTTTYPNQLVPGAAELNKRYSGSSQSTTTKTGYFVTDYIAVPDFASVTPYNARLNWVVPSSTASDVKIAYFNASKTYQGLVYIADASNMTAANGETTINLRAITGSNAPTDITSVAYVRIQLAVNSSMASLTASDIENLTITFDAVFETESTESVTTTEWSSTGIAYNQPADYEDRVIALETTTANNSADINVVKQQIANLENGETTTAIPEWWEDEVADTIAKVKALQVGRNCVTFPFFSDNHQRNGYAGVLIKRVMDECHIPYCFFGGDGIANGYFGDETDEAMREQDAKFDAVTAAIPEGRFCRAIGNHEYYWKPSSSETHYYTADQVYEVFLRQDTLTQSKEFGGDTYYYVEDKASKVRFIVMDMNTLDDAAQITWLQNVALHFDEDGWAVVLIGHQPVTEHYATVINGAAEARTALKNYINGSEAHKADVVGWWCGHVHRDRIFDGTAANPGYNGSTDPETDAATGDPISEALPWKTVSIISDNTAIGYGGVKHAIDNSDQSHAIDFVTINKGTRTVNLTRLGFGNDRSFTY